ACPRQVIAPGLEVVVGAIAAAIPAFLVVAARIGAEEDAAGLERGAKLAEDARQLLVGNVEERRVREDAVEALRRQVEAQEILLPHLAPAMRARHRGELRRAFDPDRDVAHVRERLEVAPRPAAEVENRERWRAPNRAQQRRDVLAYVVIAGSVPEILGALVVVLQRAAGDVFEVFRLKLRRQGE